MKHSKLSDHTFKKGKFITPINSLPMMQEFEDEKSWTYGRMPEYIWIGLILKYYGREEGLRKSYSIISTLHKLAPDLYTARLSQILKLDIDIQKQFYDYIVYMGVGRLVMFSEDDDISLTFKERFQSALVGTQYMVDVNRTDSYNFFMLVFGCIQQAIDVIVSCVEYGCIPYIRYPVAFHYISLLSENMLDIKHIATLRFKMSVAFVVYKLCDKNRLSTVYIEEFLNKIQEYDFNSKLFCVLNEHGINEKKFFDSTITNIVIDELEKFYSILSREEDSDKVEN